MFLVTSGLFIVGFLLLIKGADFLVEGASSIAKKFQVSDMVVGLTIVSFGTSMPELIVNVLASVNGNSEIAIGNVFGSNIANILLILGVSAIIFPLAVQKNTVLTEIPFSLIAVLLVGFLANASLFDTTPELIVSRLDGIILLFFFLLFMVYIFYIASKNKDLEENPGPKTTLTQTKAIVWVIGGVLALFIGGKLVVDGAVEFATYFGLSEAFIGLTVVAIGTSLPELVTSAMAARKGNSDIAVGNAVGSNIFNILWILGLSAVIRPLPFETISNLDILMIIFASVLLIFSLAIGKRGSIDRLNGLLFLLVYVAYLFFLVQRE